MSDQTRFSHPEIENDKEKSICYSDTEFSGQLEGIPKNFFDVKELYVKKKETWRGLSPVRDSDSASVKQRKKRSLRRKKCYHKKNIEKNKNETKNRLFPAKADWGLNKIIYLQAMTTTINPIKMVRVMDNIFPLNTSFNGYVQKVDYESCFGDMRFIKRINRIEHDLVKKTYTFFVEEKYPQSHKAFRGEETFGYFKEW